MVEWLRNFLSAILAAKNLTTNITSNFNVYASMQINADNNITSPTNLSYQADKAIILIPGFMADSGAAYKDKA